MSRASPASFFTLPLHFFYNCLPAGSSRCWHDLCWGRPAGTIQRRACPARSQRIRGGSGTQHEAHGRAAARRVGGTTHQERGPGVGPRAILIQKGGGGGGLLKIHRALPIFKKGVHENKSSPSGSPSSKRVSKGVFEDCYSLVMKEFRTSDDLQKGYPLKWAGRLDKNFLRGIIDLIDFG